MPILAPPSKRKPAKPKQARLVPDVDRLSQFTVEQYHGMIQAGVLTTNHRVELLEGWIVDKMPNNPPHIASIRRLTKFLLGVLPNSWTITAQGPITLSDSEPEPDLSIARGPDDVYQARHPGPSDLALVIEVGDSTLLTDRRYKGLLYAREKIAEFWLVNLPERKVEVYTKPRNGKYSKKVEYGESHRVPLVLDGKKIVELAVKELLPTE